MSFIKYQHLERYGNTEVEGIEVGTCYVFPKLDGTNASVWVDDSKPFGHTLCCGSRNRELELDNDNAGFMNAMMVDKAIINFLYNENDLVLYG